VRGHAQAKRVDIRLDHEDGQLLLRITDDGCGFQLEEMQARLTTLTKKS
jgi:signal transduction histidine kinase